MAVAIALLTFTSCNISSSKLNMILIGEGYSFNTSLIYPLASNSSTLAGGMPSYTSISPLSNASTAVVSSGIIENIILSNFGAPSW